MKRFSFVLRKPVIILMVLMLIFGLRFAACRNSSSSSSSNNSNSLIGTWTGNAPLIGETSYTFASDNTVKISMLGVTASGTYTVLGNSIAMRFSHGGLIPLGDINARRNGDNLVIDSTVYTKR